MIWTAPGLEIHTLRLKGTLADDQFEFELEGVGLREGVTQLCFVRVALGAEAGLKPYQVIPCTNLTLDPNREDLATFRASLYERDGGAYHLVACNPPNGKVNQADVLEWALALAALPEHPVQVLIKNPGA